MRTRAEAFDAFMDKVDKTGDCWEWQGSKTPRGYGQVGASVLLRGEFTRHANTQYAHRVMWMIMKGPIPNNLEVMHTCDNPPCVRMSHLKLGTHLDNMQDAVLKGRTHSVRS